MMTIMTTTPEARPSARLASLLVLYRRAVRASCSRLIPWSIFTTMAMFVDRMKSVIPPPTCQGLSTAHGGR